MEVRRLGPADAALAVRVVEELKFPGDGVVGVTVVPEYFRDFLSDDQRYFLACFSEGEPVGYLFAYRLARFDGRAPSVFVYEVAVAEAFRRKGFGRALMEESKRLARTDGCAKMFVPTSRGNAAAMALYRAAGGTEGEAGGTSFWWNWGSS